MVRLRNSGTPLNQFIQNQITSIVNQKMKKKRIMRKKRQMRMMNEINMMKLETLLQVSMMPLNLIEKKKINEEI